MVDLEGKSSEVTVLIIDLFDHIIEKHDWRGKSATYFVKRKQTDFRSRKNHPISERWVGGTSIGCTTDELQTSCYWKHRHSTKELQAPYSVVDLAVGWEGLSPPLPL